VPPTTNFFAGPYLDRRAQQREDEGWLEAARADAQTLYVVVRGTTQLLTFEPEPRIAFLNGEHPYVRAADAGALVLLGWFRGARCVLLDVRDAQPQELAEGSRFEELRPLSNVLAPDEAALLAYARALSVWRARHRRCGACGTPTVARRAGHVLACPNAACGQESFPRIDPAIIVLVTDGERALLGRQASWPRGRYSTIAGFVEPGESLEDAVAREVQEETGIRVDRVDYHSSQPWPFPASLMVGFHATAAPGAIACADGELEDARWFTREDIAAGTPMLPPETSISYRLIESWYDLRAARPLASEPKAARWPLPRS
jgi:NAD+ diphosphatase